MRIQFKIKYQFNIIINETWAVLGPLGSMSFTAHNEVGYYKFFWTDSPKEFSFADNIAQNNLKLLL